MGRTDSAAAVWSSVWSVQVARQRVSTDTPAHTADLMMSSEERLVRRSPDSERIQATRDRSP